MLHTKLNFTTNDSFCRPTLLECINYTPWRWPFKDWNMLKLLIAVNDDLIIYESIGVNLIYIFREFTKSRGVLYLNYRLAYHHILGQYIKWYVLQHLIHISYFQCLTLNLLTWRIWWTPNNASKWQMGLTQRLKG